MAGLVFFGKLGKFTWRMCAAVLAAQSIAVFFGALVARGIAVADSSGAATAYLLVGSGLAVLCIVAAGAVRAPRGGSPGLVPPGGALAGAAGGPPLGLGGAVFAKVWGVFAF